MVLHLFISPIPPVSPFLLSLLFTDCFTCHRKKKTESKRRTFTLAHCHERTPTVSAFTLCPVGEHTQIFSRETLHCFRGPCAPCLPKSTLCERTVSANKYNVAVFISKKAKFGSTTTCQINFRPKSGPCSRQQTRASNKSNTIAPTFLCFVSLIFH